MKRLMLALTAAAALTACSEVSTPTMPTAANGGGSTSATAFPDQENGGRLLTATLTGAQEAPGPGDADGSGSFRVTLNAGLEQVCYELTATNIDPATAAHIHVAPPGQPGPVVVPLLPPTSGSSSACTTASRELIGNIIRDPGAYYVNVHNPAFQPGAIRGQLSK